MLKIAHICPSFYPAMSYGGPIRTTLQLCQSLSRAGCYIRVLTTNTAGPAATLDVDKQREVWLETRLSVRYAARLLPESVSLALLRELSPLVAWSDVVHLTGVYNFTTLPTLLAARALKKPLVWSTHGGLQRWENTRRTGVKAAFERTCRAVMPPVAYLHVTSEEEACESGLRMPTLTPCLVPNGVFVPNGLPPRQPSDSLRLLFLGRLDVIKGIENLLEACHLLLAKPPDKPFHLTIAGGGDAQYTASLRAHVARLGLQEAVTLVGEVHEDLKADLMNEHDLLVLPSFKENFGMVVAEALAFGVPVVASDKTPWQSLERHQCGRWVDNSPASLSQTIRELSSADLVAMGARGHAHVKQAFSWQTVADSMITCYHRAVSAQRAID